MIFLKLLRLKACPLSDHSSTILTVKKLTNKRWDFGRMDGSFIDQVRLLPDGKIEGHEGLGIFNEYRWRLEGETLVILENLDQPLIRFISCAKEQGRLTGRFLLCDDTSLILMTNHSNAKLTIKELTKTTWDLGGMDGPLINQIRLLPDGKVEVCKNSDNLNEYRWRLEGETLVILKDLNQSFIRFTSCTKYKGRLFLTGYSSLCNSIIHVLMSYKAFELNLNLPINFYFGLGDAFRREERWKEAIASYRKAFKLEPRTAKSYLVLGIAQMKRGDVYGAITSCKKAIELRHKQLGWFYGHLGDVFQKKRWWYKAIASYRKARDVKPWQDQSFYLNRRNIQLKLGQYKKAKQSYKKSFEVHYLVSHKHKFIYCNIPKNATQLFRIMTVEHSDDYEKFYKWKQKTYLTVNEYLHRDDAGVRLTDYIYLDNPKYFKFAILRNPFDRLVSGYLDKFVKNPVPQPLAHPVINNVYEHLGMKPNVNKGITFTQFIRYLAMTKDDYNLDIHWRPQHTFLGIDVFRGFDFIGQFEKLDGVIEYLEKNFGFKIRTRGVLPNPKHITRYGNISSIGKFHDKYPEELRALDGFPGPQQFYTHELEKLIRKKYAKDIEIYESKFNVSLVNYVK